VGPLNDAAVVRLVAEHCIPVALNANRIPNDDAGRFFRAIMQQSRWPQGIWIASPEGKVQAFHYFQVKSGESPAQSKTRWVQETLAAIDAGLKAFGPVETRKLAAHEAMPDRGCGFCSAGARLAVYVRYLKDGKHDGDPVVDSVTIPADEWKAFGAPEATVGLKWDIPETTARRLAPALSPITDSIYTPQAADMKLAQVHASVQSVDAERAWIRYTGNLESLHHRDGDAKLPIRAAASVEGFGEWDRKQNRLIALVLVFRGSYRNVPPWDQPKSTGGVVEWQLEKANKK
jgi:hypothetical protein